MMTDDNIPPDIEEFLAGLRSVGHLELLLFLFARAESGWSMQQLSLHLRTNEHLVKQQLSDLKALVKINDATVGVFQFDKRNEKATRLMRRVADLYRLKRYAVIDAIYRHVSSGLSGT